MRVEDGQAQAGYRVSALDWLGRNAKPILFVVCDQLGLKAHAGYSLPYSPSFAATIWFTAFGLALPPVAFIT
jgi:hypothetical protein